MCCDLTHLGFFLWGFLKENVYANNPQTIRDDINAKITKMSPQLCERVIKSLTKRMVSFQRSRGDLLCNAFHNKLLSLYYTLVEVPIDSVKH